MAMNPALSLPDGLRPILQALSALEPLIYAANDGAPRAHFEALLALEFWEVGASGQRYSREHVLDVLEARQRQPLQQAWQTTDGHVQALAPDLYLHTYTLIQPTRVSRRATVWRQTPQGWQMVYHQGTVAAGLESTWKESP
jgi:hypothetical protein